MRSFLVLLGLCCLSSTGWADGGKALSPFLDERTVAVIRLDLGKLDVARLVERLATAGKLQPAEMTRTTRDWSARVAALVKDRARVAYVVVSLADIPENYPFLIVPLEKEAHADGLTKRLGEFKKIDSTIGVSRLDSALIVSSADVFKRIQKMKAIPRPDIIAALGKDAPGVRLVMVQTTDARRVLEENMPMVPEELGGGSIRPVSRGLRWLSIDIDTAEKIALRLTVQSADADSARALDGLMIQLWKGLASSKAALEAIPELSKMPELWKPKREDDRIVLALEEKTIADVTRPYVERLIITERQARASQQVRQILKAMQDDEGKHGTFPAHASYDRDGQALLSWRVHLLPMLGEGKLYREFKLDEPWDSPNNKKLLSRMPAVYRPQDAKLAAQYRTTFLVPHGRNLMFEDKRGIAIRDITDGLTHTILLIDVEDARAVEWTKPVDLPLEEINGAMGFSTRHGGKYLVGMANGSAYFLPTTMGAWSLWGLLTRNQGEVVELP
jgi:hypothetical protein